MPTAVITGASTGIGAAIAEALAPTHTLLLAGRPSARLDAVAEGLGASTWPMDLTDTAGLDETAEMFDEIDVLVHNAGNVRRAALAEMSHDDFQAVVDVHLFGAFHVVRAAFPVMIAARYGRNVLTSSIGGLYGNHDVANYAAAKAAIDGFTLGLAKEVAGDGIRVNAVAPGSIATPKSASTRKPGDTDGVPHRRAGRPPLHAPPIQGGVMIHHFTDLDGVTHSWETPDVQAPLDETGALATLLAVTGTLTVVDAANAVGLTPEALVAEAEAWQAAADA